MGFQVDSATEEETWQAQYGQSMQFNEAINFPVIDLWDWSMVVECGKEQVSRLVGRLVRRSAKLHQSLPSGGSLLRTAAIHEVHINLVRVATGVFLLFIYDRIVLLLQKFVIHFLIDMVNLLLLVF